MKKFSLLAMVFVLALASSAWCDGNGVMLRWAGTTTTSNGYNMAVDSADRIETDTVTSDTIRLADYPDAKIVIVTPVRDTVIACDSCVAAWDSVKINVWTKDNSGISKILGSGVFSRDHTRDTATTLRFYANTFVVSAGAKDSTAFDQVWVQTIMVDSVRTGMIAKDTTIYRGRYHIWLGK